LTDWGLPDWRDPSSYGDVPNWSPDRWRWEFYRRRDDLRAFFDRWADTTHEANIAANSGRSPDEPGYLAFGQDEDAGREVKEFDYAGVPNPRISAQPTIAIKPYSALVYPLRYYDPAVRLPSSRGVIKRKAEEYRLWLEPNEMAIKIQMDEPLEKQIDDASEVLRTAQQKLHGKLITKRRQKNKWLGYLRSLDAKAAGASDFDIAALHPHKRQTAQAAQEVIKAAKALMHKL
jgi:hypothetical protein